LLAVVECRSGGDIFAPEKAACIWQNMAAFLSCANEGKDNSKCCTEAGVDSGLLYDCKAR
jgi:hypothetical protein